MAHARDGTCTEDVEIRQNDVAMQGAGRTIVGQLFVNGARRVTIQNLTVRGSGALGSHDILALDGAGVRIVSVLVENIPDGNGIHLEDGSSAILDQVTIRNAGTGVSAQSNSSIEIADESIIERSRDVGAILDLGSSGIVFDSTIQDSGSTGISVFRGSSLVFERKTIKGSLEGVSLNSQTFAWLRGNITSTSASDDSTALGILWGSSARMLGGNTLTSGGFALFTTQGATLNQRGGDTVNGPISINALSNAELRNVSITGNV
jgi:hypothetical protein